VTALMSGHISVTDQSSWQKIPHRPRSGVRELIPTLKVGKG